MYCFSFYLITWEQCIRSFPADQLLRSLSWWDCIQAFQEAHGIEDHLINRPAFNKLCVSKPLLTEGRQSLQSILTPYCLQKSSKSMVAEKEKSLQTEVMLLDPLLYERLGWGWEGAWGKNKREEEETSRLREEALDWYVGLRGEMRGE